MPVATHQPEPCALSTPPASSRWTLDPSGSSVRFSTRQFWGLSTVHGRFTRFEGELELNANGDGRAELRIQAASIETGNRRRDRHLRAAGYFDCDRHPFVRFTATIAAAPEGGVVLTGELEAAGRAIALDLAATVDEGDYRLELGSTATVDARALGMTWSPLGTLATPTTLAVLASLRPVG